MAGSNTFGGTIKLEGEKQYRAAIRRLETSQSLKYSQIGDIFNFYVHFCVTTKTNQKASREDFDSSRTLLNDAKGTPFGNPPHRRFCVRKAGNCCEIFRRCTLA